MSGRVISPGIVEQLGRQQPVDDRPAGCIGHGNASCLQSPEESRSEEHTSELQSLMRISYAVFCLKKKNQRAVKQRNTVAHTHSYIERESTQTTQSQIDVTL